MKIICICSLTSNDLSCLTNSPKPKFRFQFIIIKAEILTFEIVQPTKVWLFCIENDSNNYHKSELLSHNFLVIDFLINDDITTTFCIILISCCIISSLLVVFCHLPSLVLSSVCFSHQQPVVNAVEAPSLIASAPPARHLSLLINIMVCSIFSTVPFIIDLANCARTWVLERQSCTVRCRSESY